jgi:hypothetical protein
VTDEKTIGSYRQTAICGPYSPARSFMCSTDRFESTTENSRVRGYTRKSFDIASAFLDVLGKRVSEVPDNYEQGEILVDTAMDLETNASKGLSREHSLMLQPGSVAEDSIVKMAQTFRSGTNDIDATDFLEMFLEDEEQTSLDTMNDLYVLVNFRPTVTRMNWRMDCGVAGYDNSYGLPPFFPTRLRFEDYIYRLWIAQSGVVAAHVDAAQHHMKSNYMRNPPAAEIFNEEVSNLLKRKIKSTVTNLDALTIGFDYDGEVTGEDAREILDKMRLLHQRATKAAETARTQERREALYLFAASLDKAFYSFEPDFFQQNLLRIVDDVVGVTPWIETECLAEGPPTQIQGRYGAILRRRMKPVRHTRPTNDSTKPLGAGETDWNVIVVSGPVCHVTVPRTWDTSLAVKRHPPTEAQVKGLPPMSRPEVNVKLMSVAEPGDGGLNGITLTDVNSSSLTNPALSEI